MFWGQIWRKKLRMVWRVRKHVRESFLVGTAHFSPYSFRTSLTHLLKESEYALFEGPLDPSSMEKVVAAGMQGQNSNTILDELDENTLQAVMKVLGLCRPVFSLGLQGPMLTPKNCLAETLGSMTPWMSFFSIYTAYLQVNGWKHSVDMEAYAIAKELKKTVVFMETIEEQIEVLETLSREQIADFLRRIDSWPTYTRDFMRWYLGGDLAQIARNPYGFPTRNPWVIDRRDSIFCEKMQPYLERGGAAVFVGVPHVAGVRRILMDAGYAVDQN
jgi:uncharacterized protein YbaP (TraB family)